MSYIGKQPIRTALTSSDIEDGIITAAKIEDGAVVAAEIASNAVTTAKINADAVTAAKIADDVINSEHIAADSIDAEHYAAGSVDTTALGADAVTGAKIADDAINSEHYTDGSIDTAHIADAQITAAKLASGVGGITVANFWRLTASKTDNSIISANLEIADDASSGNIGSAMTQSSGVFTFPSTGIYLINWQVKFAFSNVSDGQASVFMEATMDNSNYDVVTYTVAGSHATGGSSNFSVYGQAIVDVTNTSNVKVRFTAESMNSGTSIFGDSSVNNTSFAFIRLGDT